MSDDEDKLKELRRDFVDIIRSFKYVTSEHEREIEKLDGKINSVARDLARLAGEMNGLVRDLQQLRTDAHNIDKDLAVTKIDQSGKVKLEKKDSVPPAPTLTSVLTAAKALAFSWSPLVTAIIAIILSIAQHCSNVQVERTREGTRVTMPAQPQPQAPRTTP